MKEELLKLIEDEISYDASFSYECEKCSHAPKNYWLDHKDTLARVIAEKLNLKDVTLIHRVLQSVYTKGNRKEDALYIVEEIDNHIIGIPNHT